MNKLSTLSEKEYHEKYGITDTYLLTFDTYPEISLTGDPNTEGLKNEKLYRDSIVCPEVFKRDFVVTPDDLPRDKRTYIYKQFAEKQVKKILFASDVREIEKMRKITLQYKFEGKPISEYVSEGIKNTALFWDTIVDRRKIQCKGLSDLIYFKDNTALLFTFKLVKNCSDFKSSTINYKYYRHGAFYTEALRTIRPKLKNIRFVYITLEENFPYGIMAYELEEKYLCAGKHENQNALIQSLKSNADKKFIRGEKKIILRKPDWLCA